MQQIGAYSITSSASNCIEVGTSMPSAMAVLRLITNSNFVGCKTGTLAAFSPLRMRPSIDAHLVERIQQASAVAHQPTSSGEFANVIHRR